MKIPSIVIMIVCLSHLGCWPNPSDPIVHIPNAAGNVIIRGAGVIVSEPFAILSRRGSEISICLGSDSGLAVAKGVDRLGGVFELFGEDLKARNTLVPEGMDSFDGTLCFRSSTAVIYVEVMNGKIDWSTERRH